MKTGIEDVLLYYCSKVKLNDHEAQLVRKIFNAFSINWEYLIKQSIYHRVLPQLYENLERLNMQKHELLDMIYHFCKEHYKNVESEFLNICKRIMSSKSCLKVMV